MINFLNTAAQMVAAKSTISPDQKDLGAGTVASVVITGLVVVFIGLVLLILLVSIYGKLFDVINGRAARKAEEAKKAAEAAKAVAKPEPIKAAAPVSITIMGFSRSDGEGVNLAVVFSKLLPETRYRPTESAESFTSPFASVLPVETGVMPSVFT